MAQSDQPAVPPKGQPGCVETSVLGCRCRCGHGWIARNREKPRVCPKCKSANWDRPKKFERRTKGK